SELWAVPANSEDVAPLALYPPGFDTNGFTIFAASPSEIESLRSSSSSVAMDSGSGVSPDDTTPAAQSSPSAPNRPDALPSKGSAGTIAVAYQMYNGNGTNTIPATPIPDGSGIPGSYVKLENPFGYGANVSLPWQPFHNVNSVAFNFVGEMQKGSWTLNDFKRDDELHLSDLKGSGTFFNNADIGLLILHGDYGTSYDYTTGHPLYGIYFPIASGASAQYLRMTDMQLGGSSPTNGLKWMAILACDSLYQKNWNSMISQNAKPYNSNLHMILGTETLASADPLIGQYWADYMLGDPSTNRPPMKIRDAWYQAAIQAYKVGVAKGFVYPNPTIFAVEADPNCTEDYLQTKTNSVPSGGTWIYSSATVYPPPPQ
ncbi:MAG: DUF6345 domain-containing protein, partial [Limisphaerales bacterium]